ncbi:hypothetical protein [Nocardioides sp.]|uniref:hypothetical protein n=1 Tax=Nocardioides sp. TaxID=35761 RepID=UPI002722EFE4|nr:hypothetical protein [Nocardioides sp.]MDO9457338.1 hypothetical protein [Nocardioides sp.]
MNDLETRLSEALRARTDLVEPQHLSPASPPAVVVPLHRRRAAVLTGAAAAAVAVAAAVVALSLADDDGDAAPYQPATSSTATEAPPSPAPTTSPEPVDLSGLLPEDDPAYVDAGTPVDYDDGSTAVVEGSTLTVTNGDDVRTLEVPAGSGLSPLQVQLGQAGVGYRLFATDGGESGVETLAVPDAAGGLTAAEPADVTPVPYGFGFSEGIGGYLTFTTGGGAGLYTRVLEGDPNDNRFRVYRWEVTGPGEGGGADQPVPTLVASEVGVGCYDFTAVPETVKAC